MLTAVTLALFAAGCTPALQPNPRYVLGNPYQIGSIWYYPRESLDLDEAGIAVVAKSGPPRLTTDGEVFDQTALAAAHPTIQLPAIARLTNLENGRELTIRLNDRGAGDPHRLIEVTRRTAELLDIPPDGGARVRLRVLANESHAAADAVPGAPSLAVTAAPRGKVQVAELAPPPRCPPGQRPPAVGRARRIPGSDRDCRPADAADGSGQPNAAPARAPDGSPGYFRRVSLRRCPACEDDREPRDDRPDP